jgi:hypothetical protein
MSAVTQQKSASPRAGCGTPAQSQSCIRVDLSNGFGGIYQVIGALEPRIYVLGKAFLTHSEPTTRALER